MIRTTGMAIAVVCLAMAEGCSSNLTSTPTDSAVTAQQNGSADTAPRLSVGLGGSYHAIEGLNRVWSPQGHLSSLIEDGMRDVVIRVPDLGDFSATSRLTSIQVWDGRVSSVGLHPLEQAMSLPQIEAYLKGQFLEWDLQPEGELLRMMESVHHYVGVQGQPTVKITIEGKPVPPDPNGKRIGVVHLRGFMYLRQDVVLSVEIRPLFSDESRGFVSISFSEHERQ